MAYMGRFTQSDEGRRDELIRIIEHSVEMAKSEHAHPIRSGQIHPLEAKNGMKTALKNGAYPFKIV